MCDAMGCTNWDFEPNENGDKFIKKWTEVFKQRFSQQPPKERKPSLEDIANELDKNYGETLDGYNRLVAQAILSLLNATEGR